MSFRINIKSLIFLVIVFILFTVIGTVSHEYGHIAVAKYLGYDTNLHYGSMNYYPKGYLQDKDVKAYNLLYSDYNNTEFQDWPDEAKEKAEEYRTILEERYKDKYQNNLPFVTIGGPMQTMLTGITGLILLFLRRKSIKKYGFKIMDWFAVFLGLFWLRPVFNLAHSVGSEIITSNGKWFGGDEYYLSHYLNLSSGTIPILFGALGLWISIYIVFKVVPKNFRFTFILSGLIGGYSGFVLWMYIIGPRILP